MPGFDGTCPMGMGPMTGGGRGFCAMPAGRIGPRFLGRRFFGRGGGRGWRNWYYATGLPSWQRASMGMPAFGVGYRPDLSEKDEAQMLKEEAELLKEELGVIQQRLESLEKVQGSKE